MSDFEILRRAYADAICQTGKCSDLRVRDAFAAVPREAFLGPGPWRIFKGPGNLETTPSADPALVYTNDLFALAPERAINNGQPSMHAGSLGLLAIRPGERVLHIGAGTGYYTAILSELVGETGHVTALEIESDLAALARANLKGRGNVTLLERSGTVPPLPMSDVIYVNAGATHPVGAWLDALNDGGRLLFPLTGENNLGVALLVTRRGDLFAAQAVWPVGFVPCIGARDPAAAENLQRAWWAGALPKVKSLRRGAAPDSDALFTWNGGWLSADAG
jgi:protein-L-isoaspartate(D-aspartate) O-methyltransferase